MRHFQLRGLKVRIRVGGERWATYIVGGISGRELLTLVSRIEKNEKNPNRPLRKYFIQLLRLCIKTTQWCWETNKRSRLHTFVWSVDDTFICVVFQAAVPINQINHVLRRSDRGHIDCQTLSMRTHKHICSPATLGQLLTNVETQCI